MSATTPFGMEHVDMRELPPVAQHNGSGPIIKAMRVESITRMPSVFKRLSSRDNERGLCVCNHHTCSDLSDSLTGAERNLPGSSTAAT